MRIKNILIYSLNRRLFLIKITLCEDQQSCEIPEKESFGKEAQEVDNKAFVGWNFSHRSCCNQPFAVNLRGSQLDYSAAKMCIGGTTEPRKEKNMTDAC